MMATHTNKDAVHVMHLIKKNTIGAEIGVWMGNTSTQFLKKGLKKFYMIDPYSVEPYKQNSEMSYQEWLAKYQPITGEIAEAGFQKYYDRVFDDIKSRFKDFEEVELCRETSDNFFEKYLASKGHGNFEMLDWIYIDGDHSYEQCKKDLNNALQIVKPGGLIIGDDYGWPDAKWEKPGVTKAVNEFVLQTDFGMNRKGMTQYVIKVEA
tara:strand:+ start:18464 stop:19087 length:624 start_codon:yes stop_codon:yes gene_type:complete